jgi:PilZ domain-containing protein
MARYSADGVSGSWSQCEVVNISEGGAGLVLAGPAVERDTRLTLELAADDEHPDGKRVEATVNHVTMSPDGTMNIGIEFADDVAALVVLKITNELAPILTAV